jgi:hypothetical protein
VPGDAVPQSWLVSLDAAIDARHSVITVDASRPCLMMSSDGQKRSSFACLAVREG